MTQLEGCIKFWESKLKSERYLMDQSTLVLIERTIKYLKKLQESESEEGS